MDLIQGLGNLNKDNFSTHLNMMIEKEEGEI